MRLTLTTLSDPAAIRGTPSTSAWETPTRRPAAMDRPSNAPSKCRIPLDHSLIQPAPPGRPGRKSSEVAVDTTGGSADVADATDTLPFRPPNPLSPLPQSLPLSGPPPALTAPYGA